MHFNNDTGLYHVIGTNIKQYREQANRFGGVKIANKYEIYHNSNLLGCSVNQDNFSTVFWDKNVLMVELSTTNVGNLMKLLVIKLIK